MLYYANNKNNIKPLDMNWGKRKVTGKDNKGEFYSLSIRGRYSYD